MQLSLTTYQIIAGALINATALIIGVSLNVFYAPWLQRKRDNERWAREKLYDLHSEAYETFTSLLKSVSITSPADAKGISPDFHALVGALNRLRLAYKYNYNDSSEILSIENDIRLLYDGRLIPKKELGKLEDLRQRLLEIAQNDLRLQDLFN
jgi:hypothetical protein